MSWQTFEYTQTHTHKLSNKIDGMLNNTHTEKKNM